MLAPRVRLIHLEQFYFINYDTTTVAITPTMTRPRLNPEIIVVSIAVFLGGESNNSQTDDLLYK